MKTDQGRLLEIAREALGRKLLHSFQPAGCRIAEVSWPLGFRLGSRGQGL